MRVPLNLIPKLFVVFAFAVAMAAVGFGHRGFNARAMDPAYIAFVAAGGTAQDLCEGHEALASGAGHSEHQAAGGCDACRLVDAAMVPAVEPAADPWLAPRMLDRHTEASQSLPQGRGHRLAQGRAPPRA